MSSRTKSIPPATSHSSAPPPPEYVSLCDRHDPATRPERCRGTSPPEPRNRPYTPAYLYHNRRTAEWHSNPVQHRIPTDVFQGSGKGFPPGFEYHCNSERLLSEVYPEGHIDGQQTIMMGGQTKLRMGVGRGKGYPRAAQTINLSKATFSTEYHIDYLRVYHGKA